MKVYILVDENRIVRCISTEECNLHTDKLHMNKYHVQIGGLPGDEYDLETDTWISRPENYPQPSKEQVAEQLIQEEMRILTRADAIQNLKDRGELDANYKEIMR